jgi:transposase-like protein
METVTMSYEELDRVGVIERVIERRLTQREAARMLGLTSRQVRRLRRAYERDGPEGLASKHRGRPDVTLILRILDCGRISVESVVAPGRATRRPSAAAASLQPRKHPKSPANSSTAPGFDFRRLHHPHF